MTIKKEDLSSKKRWQKKWKLSDPETLKDIPDNPDLGNDKRKLLFGDFVKKAKYPNLKSLALAL